jgi:hypothetical protein
MAGNVFSYQVLKDSTEHAVIKLTGLFDGTGGQEANNVRIQANTLYGALDSSKGNLLVSTANTGPLPYYGLSVFRVWGINSSINGSAELFWNAGTKKTIMYVAGTTDYDGYGNWLSIPNNAQGTLGCNGDIGISTTGMSANDAYTIVVELRKDNAMYQRGQFNDPAAFNYGTAGMRP